VLWDDVVFSLRKILVGVDVKCRSKELLAYVSGLGPRLAEAVVKYRNEHGPFRFALGSEKMCRVWVRRAFEQAAGFLRIRDGDNPWTARLSIPKAT